MTLEDLTIRFVKVAKMMWPESQYQYADFAVKASEKLGNFEYSLRLHSLKDGNEIDSIVSCGNISVKGETLKELSKNLEAAVIQRIGITELRLAEITLETA